MNFFPLVPCLTYPQNICLSLSYCCSAAKSCPTLWPHGLQHARLPCPSLSPRVFQTLVCWVGDTIQPSHPLSTPILLLPSIFPSIRVFPSELALCIRCPKYWSFRLSISPSNKYSGLISFRIDWFDLLPIQGTLKSLLQHHNSKASIPQRSAFCMVQLSHPYMATGKIIALTIQTFVSKVIFLLFNTLFRFAITFLPRSKSLLIS